MILHDFPKKPDHPKVSPEPFSVTVLCLKALDSYGNKSKIHKKKPSFYAFGITPANEYKYL